MPRKLKDGWRNPIPCFMQAKILVDVNIFFRTQTCKLLLIYQVQQTTSLEPTQLNHFARKHFHVVTNEKRNKWHDYDIWT